MNLHLTVCIEDAYSTPRSHYERDVPWLVPPDKGEIIFVGRDEAGETSSINARVQNRSFLTDGIYVEARVEHCREEYEAICQSVLRDGFTLKYRFD